MMKILFVPLFLFAAIAHADDHRSQWAAGGGLGANFPAPWAKGNFTSTVDPKLPRAGAWVRYNYGSPELGLELSYNYLTLAKQNVRTHAVIFQWFSRMLPDSLFHPHLGFGIGWSKSEHFYRTDNYETPIFQLRAGLDYALERNTDLSFYLDHFTVFRNYPNEPNMHVLAPTIALTHYFGESAQQKAPAKSTEKASENAPAAAAAPTTSQSSVAPESSVVPSQESFSPSKAKKKRKRRIRHSPARAKQEATP